MLNAASRFRKDCECCLAWGSVSTAGGAGAGTVSSFWPQLVQKLEPGKI